MVKATGRWSRRPVPGQGDRSRGERNHIWLMLMDPARRELFTDWARSSRLAVAKFRADSVSHLGDPAFEELIAALQRPSPDFCKACKRHEVARTVSGRKELRHPEVGTMVFEHALFNPADAPEPRPADAPEQRLILYTPLPEHDTPAKLERLLGR